MSHAIGTKNIYELSTRITSQNLLKKVYAIRANKWIY
jgi:hypothetical protein